MLAVNYSTIRENLKTYCDKVNDDSETVIVTRKDNRNVVLMSLDEYNNLMENLKILKNPQYFVELYQSMKQIEQGHIILKTSQELDGVC